MKYLLAYGSNVNKGKMEIVVNEKMKDRPLNSLTSGIVKGESGNDHTAENAR